MKPIARFNPRARVGRDRGGETMEAMTRQVSIHAPAWGATTLNLYSDVRSLVSIHAPAWGATAVLPFFLAM